MILDREVRSRTYNLDTFPLEKMKREEVERLVRQNECEKSEVSRFESRSLLLTNTTASAHSVRVKRSRKGEKEKSEN